MAFKIHGFTDPWPDETTELRPCFTASLDGRLTILKPASSPSLWIWAEDNEPAKIEVHVAVARRVAIDELTDEQPFTINGLQGAY